MRLHLLALLLFPGFAWASVSGMDDRDPNITPQTQQLLDETITTYYQQPTVAKVNAVLDIMNDTYLLRKKTAWSPMIGFLSVVFKDNKQHVFSWMGRNDYNTYAQDVFVAALLHAKLKEAALVFAQAHQWKVGELHQLSGTYDDIDLKHLTVMLPGHIDTLWGAFFASGDPAYVNEIIDVLFENTLPNTTIDMPEDQSKVLPENKKLAESTLRQYAAQHKPVRDALRARIASEAEPGRKQQLEALLSTGDIKPPLPISANSTAREAASLAMFAALGAVVLSIWCVRQKRKT